MWKGYYKTLSDLTQYTIRQTGGGPGNQTLTVNQDFYTGSGNAKGIEVLIQKKLGRYTGWISYTLADAEDKFAVYGNNYFPADQDIRHEFKTVNLYHYSRWNFLRGVYLQYGPSVHCSDIKLYSYYCRWEPDHWIQYQR